MIRVGFVIERNTEQWTGGVSYYSNLFGALYGVSDRTIEPVVLIGSDTEVTRVVDRLPVEVIRASVLDQSGAMSLARRGLRRLLTHDRLLEALLVKHRVAVLSHSGWLGERSTLPAIGWIPDLQHVHYPEFFSATEIAIRDRLFSAQCRLCDRVLVSSESAMKELSKRDPACTTKARVLRFVARSPGDAPAAAGDGAAEGGNYFYLPNQFWVHKNHRLVIEAARLLKASGRHVRVLATGQTADYRHPGLYESLCDAIREAGLADSFILLGLVPRNDVGRLMRHAVAVINPSLYEGWSTTVEEAKSLGKRMILSDIPVHREQAPADGVYFDPHKPAELADVLWRVWSEFDPVQDQRRMRRALAEWPRRQAEFAREYVSLVREVLESRRQGWK